jgi:hypothetical protein
MATKQTGTPNGGRNRSAHRAGQETLDGPGTTHLRDGVEPPTGGHARTLWGITVDEWDDYLAGGVGFDELQARAERRITMHTGNVGENHPDAGGDA